MSAVSKYNNKLVVRPSNKQPSPFLVECEKTLVETVRDRKTRIWGKPKALDLGCGAGRQAKFLQNLGFEVLAFDRKPDFGFALELGEGPLPVFSDVVNIVVLSYILMFLDEQQLDKLFVEVLRVAAFECVFIVELSDVKNSLYHGHKLVEVLNEFERRARAVGFQTVIRRKHHLLSLR